MASEFRPRPSSDLGSIQTEFSCIRYWPRSGVDTCPIAARRSLIASQNRGDPTDAVGSGLHPGWTFINTERQVYRFNPVAVTENLKAIYRGSRLLAIAETDLRRRHRPLQNLPYEEQMLEGLGAFDGALSPGGGLVDSLSPPGLAK